MEQLLQKISVYSIPELLLLFLAENVLTFVLAISFGYYILQKYRQPIRKVSRKDWFICLLTNLTNTLVTYTGFYLWQTGLIEIDFNLSIFIITNVVILLLAMDLLMYIFHWFIHRSAVLHRLMHALHHEASAPQPTDLFVLHPFEALGFGGLWLGLLMLGSFNIYGIIIYLILNVIIGIIGHLGFEPLAYSKLKDNRIIRFLGTSAFHHRHHLDMKHNFGFYTSLWDRLFGTYKSN